MNLRKDFTRRILWKFIDELYQPQHPRIKSFLKFIFKFYTVIFHFDFLTLHFTQISTSPLYPRGARHSRLWWSPDTSTLLGQTRLRECGRARHHSTRREVREFGQSR